MPYKDPVRAAACVRDSHKAIQQKRRVWMDGQKLGKSCFDCGTVCGTVWGPRAFDWHHRDPATKDFTIGSRYSRVSLKRLAAEIAKCDLHCSNCHRAI